MNTKKIEHLIKEYITQSTAGLDKENPKFDFKAIWYDLKSPKDISEFLKDTTSIANTFGPDGYIVIGFDDKRKTYTQQTFKDCNLRDSSDIINLINGKVDSLFTLNTVDIEISGNKLSVIHIPPSIEKPHVIKKYFTYEDGKIKKEEDNKIFVRKNSRAFSASKYDIDLMYYDKKNITPEYQLHSSFNVATTSFGIFDDRLHLTTVIAIENSGRRPVAITGVMVTIEFGEGTSIELFEMISATDLIGHNMIINSGQICAQRIALASRSTVHCQDKQFENMKQQYYNQQRSSLKYGNLQIKLANGDIIYSELKMLQ